MQELTLPVRHEWLAHERAYGKIAIEPFAPGFALTVGNAYRRVLLSSISGAAPTWVKIEGVLHEFSHLPGVREDTLDIILNLRKVVFTLHVVRPKLLRLKAQGVRTVTAKDFELDPDVGILTPDGVLATLERDGNLEMEACVERGRGYQPAETREPKEPLLQGRQLSPLEFDQDRLQGLVAEIFREVCSGGIRDHVAGLESLLLRLAVRQRESRMDIGEEHHHGGRMPVHHRDLTRPIPNPQHPHPVVLHLHGVVLRIHRHRIARRLFLPSGRLCRDPRTRFIPSLLPGPSRLTSRHGAPSFRDLSQLACRTRTPESPNTRDDLPKQAPCQVGLGQLQGEAPSVSYETRAASPIGWCPARQGGVQESRVSGGR